MSYSDTSIVIHLLKDATNTTLDDTVRIVKNLGDSVFEVIYKDCDNSLDGNKHLVHKAYEMTRDNVCNYVYLLLKNLVFDEDSYEQIQFSLPAMPRVLINVSNLKDPYYREHFLELVESGLSMLDKVEKLNIKKPSEKKNSDCKNCQKMCYNASNSAYDSYCTPKRNLAHPDLPASPIHRYFE